MQLLKNTWMEGQDIPGDGAPSLQLPAYTWMASDRHRSPRPSAQPELGRRGTGTRLATPNQGIHPVWLTRWGGAEGVGTEQGGMDLRADIVESIRKLAERNGVNRVVLFGSRARGDNRKRSDIDLAATGGNVAAFSLDVDEETPTLLMYDVVDLDGPVQPELLKEIERDGVVLYERPEA